MTTVSDVTRCDRRPGCTCVDLRLGVIDIDGISMACPTPVRYLITPTYSAFGGQERIPSWQGRLDVKMEGPQIVPREGRKKER